MKPSFVIIGLGNPGNAYARTRHNAGFRAIDTLADAFGEGEWQDKPKFLSQTLEARINDAPVLLVKPQTFMNRSGEAVAKIVDFFKLDPASRLLVLNDDIDLPLGELRLRKSGGPGTHNGLKSIVTTLGENFPRLRIGIGAQPPGEDLANWVLSIPSAEEAEKIDTALKTLADIVAAFVREQSAS